MLCLVVMPTLAAALYYGVVATPSYTSTSSFVVRKPNASGLSVFNKILQTAGLARTQDDGFVVHQFLISRDAVALLERRYDLVGHYGAASVDSLAAFPGLFHGVSAERLHKYLQHYLDVEFDPTSGVSRLAVRSFDPAFSQALNNALLLAAEELINRMNKRWREDTIRYAVQEVAEREAALAAAHERITAFRTRSLLVDPTQLTEELGKTITGLAWSLAQARARLQALEPERSDSPQAAAVRRTITSLEQQIVEERRKIAGDEDSIAQAIADYERLFMDQEFAERALTAAMTSLENAKQQARRRQVYLERIVEPAIPDYPSHPTRILNILIVFGLSVCIFVIARFVIREVASHAPG